VHKGTSQLLHSTDRLGPATLNNTALTEKEVGRKMFAN